MTNTSENTAQHRWTTEGMTTIPALMKQTVEKWPDRTFLDFTGDKHTYAAIDSASNRIARGLAALGLSSGDCVLAMMDNHADFVSVWFAVSKLGAIFVPLNTNYKGTYLKHQVRDTAARIMIAETHYLKQICDVFDDSMALEMLVCRGTPPAEPMPVRLIELAHVPSADDSPVVCEVKPLDPAVIHYTSGTTGPSKGGVMCHNYFCHLSTVMAVHHGLTTEDVYWTPCPLFHGSGMTAVIGALSQGATVSIYPHFSVSNFWPEMERSGATVVMLLSIMLALVPDQPDTEVSKRCYGQIRVVHGFPFGPKLKETWRKRFGVKHAICPGYGGTEAAPVTMSHYDEVTPVGASGRPYPAFDVRVVDDDGNECPRNVAGEIIVRPNRPGIMFSGYWRRPEATLAVFKDLWYWTGDIGKYDEQGFFYFVDRKKDYLRKGGENISSFEVEETFLGHPGVSQVAAHAVPSPFAEDDLKVTIVRAHGADVSEAELHAWSVSRLPKFAIPRYIEFRTELPTTGNGKVTKHVLKEQGVTPNTWDSGPYRRAEKSVKQPTSESVT